MVCLRLGSIVVSIVVSIVSVAASFATAGDDMPTVMVVADNQVDGPAGWLACRQIRHWPATRGRLIVEPDILRAAVRLKEETSRLDWLIVLRESYDARSSIPAADGSTLRGVASGDEGRGFIETVLKTINSRIEESTEHWHAGKLSRTERTRYAGLAGDGARVIVVTTSAKRENTNRLWSRVREQRLAVHSILRKLDVISADLSPDRMTPPSEGRKGKVAFIAIYDGPGAVSSSGHDPLWILRSLSHLGWLEASLLGPDEIRDGALDQYDVVLFGGGGSRNQATSLGNEGREEVRRFVHRGGGYVGICAGAYLASCNSNTYLAIINARMPSGKGTAVVPLRFTDAGAIVATCGRFDAKYSGGSRDMVEAGRTDLPAFRPLAYFAGDASPEMKLNGSVAVAYAEYGKGRVIVFSPHCERFPGPQETFWKALGWCYAGDLSGLEITTTP